MEGVSAAENRFTTAPLAGTGASEGYPITVHLKGGEAIHLPNPIVHLPHLHSIIAPTGCQLMNGFQFEKSLSHQGL
ncbi:hypothetical protein C1H46_024983 [Malus baccata]|uniref:Uncharacterized protein n=1 Tax=Malus baccata TaxID=106549 RepID=A0A540LSQ5_MALBA|nr:hypothetical protein C1H46_024983 [Malus baccata]